MTYIQIFVKVTYQKDINIKKNFEKEYVPTFKYKIGDVEIEKTICMEYGRKYSRNIIIK